MKKVKGENTEQSEQIFSNLKCPVTIQHTAYRIHNSSLAGK